MKIGVDLGGTNTVVGICTDEGKLLEKQHRPTPTGDAPKLLRNLYELARSVCDAAGVQPGEVVQIGIGVPGTFQKSTCTLTFGTNLGMNDVHFGDAFAPEFTCPVLIDNDGNSAALGEYIAGAGGGGSSMMMVTLGTGVGGGLIVGGKLYTGENDIAGEIGHMVIAYGGLPCNCGRHGCLETYASATGMIRMAERAMSGGADTLMRGLMQENGGSLTAKMVCDARDAGDTLAEQVFHEYVGYLACGMNNIIAILQPQKIVLGGGVAGYGDKLLIPLRERVERELMKAPCKQAEIVLAALGNDAGIIGAAMLER